MKIAFIGLGNMGLPMARNLVVGGYEVSGIDLSPASIAAFRDAGGSAGTALEPTVRDAAIVITMLPRTEDVLKLYQGAGSLLALCAPGTLLIDCSTIDGKTTVGLAAAAEAAGLRMLDAPVSGGTRGAVEGTLTFMVGGRAEDLEKARPVLAAMGKTIVHAGASGAGHTAKLCNNLVAGICMVATCEALAMGMANGLDPVVLSEIMRTSTAANFALDKYNPVPGVMANVPAGRNYEGGFRAELMLKDMSLATALAAASGLRASVGEAAREKFAEHCRALGHLDYSSVLRTVSQSKPD
ncbi:MAG: 3-hydroxyisobutyrate dehydrogenase [Hyphomicrobiaceae bacterium]